MDNRTEIINETLLEMQRTLTTEQLQKLKNTLYIQLDQYEVNPRSTAVAVCDDSPQKMLKKYIATKRVEGKSEGTLEQYYLRCSMMLDIIGKPIDEITAYDLRFYLAEYKEKRGVSNRTLNNIRQCIKGFFHWLKDEGMIESNPCDGLQAIKYEKQIRLPFTATDMEELRRACDTKRDRAIIEFLYSTGCRVSEAVALDRTDIDWQRKQAIVHGKGNKQRTVYLSDVCVMYLTEYLNTRHDNNTCLFASIRKAPVNERLSVGGVQGMLKTLGKKAGISDVHPHRFRRTFASNMISRGARIEEVAMILGHEEIETTQVYCHIDSDNVENTYKRCIA